MLKLDPEDADSDADESRDKSKLNSSTLMDDSLSLNSTRTSQIISDKSFSVSTPNNSIIQTTTTLTAVSFQL